MIYVCCVERRECIRGVNPLYVASIAMNLLSVSKGLSPGEKWSEYHYYRSCWKRWARDLQGCAIFASFGKLPEGYRDITDEVIMGYAELMEKEWEIPRNQFVENYWRG